MSKTISLHFGKPSPASQAATENFLRVNIKPDRLSLTTDLRSTEGALLEEALRAALLQVVEYNHMMAMAAKRKQR